MRLRKGFVPNPWILFGIYLAANSLLSYFSFSIGIKLGIGLLGLALPFLGALLLSSPVPPKAGTLEKGEFLPAFPLGGWGLVALLAVAARFTCLTTLFVWPNFDESSYGFDAFQLADHAGPRFFYGVSQAPPLYIWGLALFFKAFGASLATVWFFPALVSLSAVPLAYAAARNFFSRSFSFLCAGLMAASFWPVFVGRFSLMTILILPMECLALFFLGRFLKASTPSLRNRAAWGLGAVWGLGFYTHLHWPVVAVLTGLPFLVWVWEKRKDSRVISAAARALGAALVIFLPLLAAAMRQHYGGYLSHLWAFNSQFSWARQFSIWASCLTAPFWGMDVNVHTYQPQWGGFLNPVLSSLFFLGLGRVAGQWKPPLHRFLALGLVLCLLPGLLTQDMETFRLFPMVPLLILVCLLGLTPLLGARKPSKNLLLVLALFLPSMALDAVHLFGAYHRIWEDPASWGDYTKSVGRYRAYGRLQEWREKLGTGLVFPDFVQGLPDQSLSVAVYGFNAAVNPRLSPDEARWAAVLANVNYKPFLQSRFPDATAYALTRDLKEPDGGWMLFAFPLDDQRRKEMENWCAAQRALESFIDVNLCYVMGQSFERDLEALSKVEPAFQVDPFLRAAFLEKKADLLAKQALMDRQAPEVPSSAAQEAAESLEEAVAQGYPAAHLYERLGVLWWMGQRPQEARKAFEKAVHCPLNLTDSSGYLSNLGPVPLKGH